ncbi:hypothetical protein H5392_14015 [Tessaracoccus sp. MC1865]|uniref:hypothetical protein n=1 Tax=Tessaracoccus sp. MC1865 TaxID=2760310 RepID=UPI0016030D78|nr:hypothetical protein [Tessaracoccus sp. MC1865]MBB1484973.1 hypothetical protein [Tessaracoccus sp. MC1865]QTO38680.1 hypothetical protein J7D54_06310 [Tessaracoccus sp. MC1865]
MAEIVCAALTPKGDAIWSSPHLTVHESLTSDHSGERFAKWLDMLADVVENDTPSDAVIHIEGTRAAYEWILTLAAALPKVTHIRIRDDES